MYEPYASYFVCLANRYKRINSSILDEWKELYQIPNKEEVEYNARLIISLLDLSFEDSNDLTNKNQYELFCQSTGNKIVDKLIQKKSL